MKKSNDRKIKKEDVLEEKIAKTEKDLNEKSDKTFFKNKKFIIILLVITGCCLGFSLMVGKVLSGVGSKENNTGTIKLDSGKKVSIKQNAASKVSYEEFDNGLVKFTKPKGWEVVIAPTDYIHYTFKVYNPENPDYMFFFAMKQEGFMKSEKARNWQKKYYPSVVFAKLTALDPQTTEVFYKNWNTNVKWSNKEELKMEYFPYLDNFKMIEKIGKSMLGGDILRATYTNSNNSLNQGLFIADIKSAGSYYVSENIFNIFSKQIDVSPLMVYNIIFMSAPDAEFNEWQPILEKCLNTIEFSQTFVNAFNKEESSLAASIQANQKVYNQISDMIMSSWENRNNSYDIISQKRSDATLGYERVYDTDTGEIYKAYNGFTDDYSGNKYKPITDDMYTKPTSGYIE